MTLFAKNEDGAGRAGLEVSLSFDETYVAESAKLEDLRRRLQSAEDELRDMNQKAADLQSRALDVAAEAVLAGKGVSSTDQPDRKAVQRQVDVLRRAVAMQEGIVRAARSHASAALCERLRPTYLRMVSDIAEALISLGNAIEAEVDFRRRLQAEEVQFAGVLLPMPVRTRDVRTGEDPRHPGGMISWWLRDAVNQQLIDESVIPARWREIWDAPRRY